MTSFYLLWLPIVVSAGIVFVASSIIHMGPFWHRNDYPKIPNEDQLRAAVGPLGIPPGEYLVPRITDRAEMRSPEFAEKVRQGPNLIMTVRPNAPIAMGNTLVQWFVYTLVVSALTGWIAGYALPVGTPYLRVFRLVAVAAFVGYAAALWQMSIWYGRRWYTALKTTIDGIIYGLLTAGAFGWLWPR